jgi:hypothetical protein
MSHYAADAVFISPAVLVAEPGSNGCTTGKAAIRELYRHRLERSTKLRFEVEDVIERPYGVIVIYRKIEGGDAVNRRQLLKSGSEHWNADGFTRVRSG